MTSPVGAMIVEPPRVCGSARYRRSRSDSAICSVTSGVIVPQALITKHLAM
jgi:hypothetical protein